MANFDLNDYVQVNERVTKFYEKYPQGSIQTELIMADDTRVIIKAYAYRNAEDPRPSTGHAEEVRGSSYINKTSAVENCETSAIGRALANLGFEIKHSIASREEVTAAKQKQDHLKQMLQEIADLAKLKKVDLKTKGPELTKKESSKEWDEVDAKKVLEFLKVS